MKIVATLFFYIIIFCYFISFSQIQQINKLIPDESGRWFGSTVAIEGDLVVVGCPYDTTNGQSSGSVYIYDLAGNSPVKIFGDDVDTDDNFGSSIAINGQTIAVGAPHSGPYWEGAVYIFEKNSNGEWIQKAKLTKNSGTEQFGKGVSLDGDKLMIGTDHDSAYVYLRVD
ncbi:MAG: hypothetical protein R3250_16040, partial [Melioribacteraceae bacterium]|nr:hypothetical protein [Melioribacteraceae bacterium]